MRELSQEEVEGIDWNEVNTEALADACETNLTVLACTGLEDKL